MSGGWTKKHTLRSVLATVVLLALAWVSAPLCLPLELSCFMAIMPMTWMTYRGTYQAWPGYLYFCVLALFLFREFAIMLRKEIPCGLCTYSSRCTQTPRSGDGCTEWVSDLVPDSCRSTTRDMDWGSLWAGATPAIVSLCILAAGLYRWSFAKLEGWATAQVNVILFLPATYAVCSLYSLRLLTVNRSDLWTPKAVFDIGDLYTAVCLFAFEQLVTKIVEVKRRKELDQLQETKGGGLKAFESLGNRLMQLGCYPYVGLCFCANFMEIVMKEVVDFWLPEICTEHIPALVHMFFPSLVGFELDPAESFDAFKDHHGSYACKEVWGALSLPIQAMNFVVCSIAVTCIVIYEQAMEHSLESIKPKMKFFAVKGLLLVIFWQDIILGALFPTDAWMKSRVNSFMLIWEACILGVMQYVSYKHEDLVIVAEEEPEGETKTRLGKVNEAISATMGGISGLARGVPGLGGGQDSENGGLFGIFPSWDSSENSKDAKGGKDSKVPPQGAKAAKGGGVDSIDWDYKEMDQPPDRTCTGAACTVS